jgi:hypothetical protein
MLKPRHIAVLILVLTAVQQRGPGAAPPAPPVVSPDWTPRPATGKAEPWEKFTDKDWVNDRLSRMDTGPFFNATFAYPLNGKQQIINKGTAIKLDRGRGGLRALNVFDVLRGTINMGALGAYLLGDGDGAAAAILEDEQIARERVALQLRLDHRRQPVEALAAIDGLKAEPNAAGQTQRQHEVALREAELQATDARSGDPLSADPKDVDPKMAVPKAADAKDTEPKAATNVATARASAPAGTRTTRPLGSTTSSQLANRPTRKSRACYALAKPSLASSRIRDASQCQPTSV